MGLLFFMVTLGASIPQQALAGSEKKPIELSFAFHVPLKASPAKAFSRWAEELSKRTNGELKIKMYPSQTLVKARDAYDAVVNGIVDIAWGAHAWTRGRFPLISVMELPFLSPGTYGGSYVLNDLYKKFPELRAEHNDVHTLFLWCTLPYEIHTVKKPVRKLEDMKGMKLSTQAGAVAVLTGLDAVPVTTPTPKIYMTVEKGVSDGCALAWGAVNAWKLYEVTKYHTNANLGSNTYWTAMNKNTWARLPDHIKKAISEVTAEMMPDTLSGAVTAAMDVGIKKAIDRNQEIINLSEDERARWVKTGDPIRSKWVKKMEAKGLPGKAVLDAAVKLSGKYDK